MSIRSVLSLVSPGAGESRTLGPVSVDSFHWSPDGEKAVYEQGNDLWVIDVETGQIENLTETPDRVEYRPRWSPDGRYIGFLRSRVLKPGETVERLAGALTSSIVVMDADGVNYQEMNERSVSDFSWSPDGEQIAYSDAGGSLYVLERTSGEGQPLALAHYSLQDSLHVSSVAWSPTADEIAISFSSRPAPEDTSVKRGCAVLNLKDRSSRILKRYEARLLEPYEGIPPGETLCCLGPGISWSSSGQHVLVNIQPLPRTDVKPELLAIDAQSGNEQSLAGMYGAYSADWSPDGRWVAYIDNGDRSLWIVNPFDPAERHQIMGPFCCEGPVAWRPGWR